MRLKSLFLIFLIFFLSAFLNASEKTVLDNKKSEKKSGIDFRITENDLIAKKAGSDNIEKYQSSARTNRIDLSTGVLIGGVVALLFGIAGIGAGIPMWYYSAIGLGIILYHPGVIEVRPINGNYSLLWLAYSFGVVFMILGSLLFVAGIAMIVAGIAYKPRRISLYYKNDFDLKTNAAYSAVGVNIKL